MYTRRTKLQKYHISVTYPEHILARAPQKEEFAGRESGDISICLGFKSQGSTIRVTQLADASDPFILSFFVEKPTRFFLWALRFIRITSNDISTPTNMRIAAARNEILYAKLWFAPDLIS